MKETTQPPVISASIPREKLGLPGAAYQLHTQGRKKGEALTPPSHTLQDNYRVVLTLNRTMPDSQSLNFESGISGDSYIQFAKPENERSAGDFDEMVIFYGHGSQRLEITGKANQQGRLAKLSVETSAPSFPEAEKIAFGAASPFLSALAFELDVPVRLTQMDVTQMSSHNSSMTYTCPYTEMVPTGNDHNNVPYVQSLLSLYREGINSNSPNYQFLCWYKIVEGVNVKRAEETTLLKKALPMKFVERLEKTKAEQRKRLEEIFPIVRSFGATDERWDDIVPDEVLDWKFNRVREQKLEPLRNRIAHMISEPSGDLSLSPDSRENAREVTKWISLLRFIARVMILNEKDRIPQPAPAFTMPKDAKHIDELRRGMMGSEGV
ncbi:MAG TPA: methylamine utilization protein MauJ [Candidatus Dormibacteraeota bacterium]|jgi:hypothetical protein|nr:methylamine utilization protein MauJ [Candidatus Dormibacteraeota bacterium]